MSAIYLDYAATSPVDPAVAAEMLACLGPAHCQRPFRAVSCRQFPFFPYISSSLRFIGLAHEWEFENTCWVMQSTVCLNRLRFCSKNCGCGFWLSCM